MSLLAHQRDMRAWLAHADPAAAARVGERAAPGLRIYQNNYRAQLVACLDGSFPRTRDWMGDTAFLAAAAFHIDRLPPSSWTLDAYSRDFPDTLATLYPDDPEIGELAWIDFAIEDVFVAADAPVATASDLSHVDWDHAVLHLIPALAFHPMTTNAVAIWSALAEDQTPPPATAEDQPLIALIWRKDHASRLRAIDAHEHRALLTTLARQPFAMMCAEAVQMLGEEEGVARAGLWLGRWLADGLISAVTD